MPGAISYEGTHSETWQEAAADLEEDDLQGSPQGEINKSLFSLEKMA